MRILLTGHGCAPDTGSEPGVTWNWAAELARSHDVWVITHAYFRPQIERHLAQHPLPRLRFVYTDRLGWWDPLRLPSNRWIRLHYHFWLRRVLSLSRELDEKYDFDVLHHVGWTTVNDPPLLWKIGKPFIWGPIGGGQTTPFRLLSLFGSSLPAELLRTLRVFLLPFVPSLRRCTSRAVAVFSVNDETTRFLRRAGRNDCELVADVGVADAVFAQPTKMRPETGTFTVLWAGRLEPRKGVWLCLEAARLTTNPDVEFIVAGDGPLAASARRWADQMHLGGRVRFLGECAWHETQLLHQQAHVFLFSSVRDTFGNAALEALAAGAPLICIDHQGVGAHVPHTAAIKVPVGRPARVAAIMAEAIDNLAADRNRLAGMSAAARRYAETQRWSTRASAMERRYAAVIQNWKTAAARSAAEDRKDTRPERHAPRADRHPARP